jgi:hypothetical protein
MSLAIKVRDACCGIHPHPAGAVLMADAFERNTLLEGGVEGRELWHDLPF